MEPISTDKLTQMLGRQRKDNVAASVKRAIASKELRLGRHYVEHGRKREVRLTLDGLDALDGVLRLSPEELVALTRFTSNERSRETKSSAEQAISEISERTRKLELALSQTQEALHISRAKVGFNALLCLALCNPDTIADPMAWAENKLKEAGFEEDLLVRITPRSAHIGYITGAFKRLNALEQELGDIPDKE